MVELESTFNFNHISAGLTTVDDLTIIFNSAGMIGMHHGHSHTLYCLRSTFIHWLNLLRAFFLEPHAKLVNADNLRIVLLR